MSKRAFTLLELVFVIVILGVVSTMTLNFVFSIYRNYLQSEVISRVSSQADLVLDQISKRLEYRIKDTVIGRNKNNNNIISLNDYALNNNYDVLEFIPYSHEAFNLGIYSGVAELNNTITTRSNGLKSPGSSFNNGTALFNDILSGSRNRVNFGSSNDVAIIFKGLLYNVDTSFGFRSTSNLDIGKVKIRNNEVLDMQLKPGKDISEQYHLAYTGYAIVPNENGSVGANRDFDLYLHYNYRPWLGQSYLNGQKVLLARNVSMFKFKGDGDMVYLKLCIRDNQSNKRTLGKDNKFDFTVCRTKAVY